MRKIMSLVLALCLVSPGFSGDDVHLKEVLAASHRGADEKARDMYRHPYETLTFFGIKEDMTVVEIWPGGGWYTGILAPYLKDKGKLIAAVYDREAETQKPWMKRINADYEAKYVNNTAVNGTIHRTDLVVPDRTELAPAGSVDMILDFRNAHNWIGENADAMAKSWFAALKKGGTVGLIDHRMDDDKEYNPKNGYIHQKQIVAIMERNGFKLAGHSDINRNAKDTKDHPQGVWTLPPTLALGKDKSAKYLEIGESDRLTLKFTKP